MRILVQRVKAAAVFTAEGELARIGQGLMALVGIREGDTREAADWLAEKLLGLRIFPDGAGRMGRSVREIGGDILLVSQFTLYGTLNRGLRPDFRAAMNAGEAEPLYDYLIRQTIERYPGHVQTGRFGADMDVELVNWGPVTLLLEKGEAHASGIAAAAGSAGCAPAGILESGGDASPRLRTGTPLSL